RDAAAFVAAVRGTSALQALPREGRARRSDMLSGTKLETLLAKLRRALDERNGGDAEAAEKLFREVVAEAQRLGVTSAFMHYMLSGLLDRVGRLGMAFDEP